MNFITRFLEQLRYEHSKKYRSSNERETDLFVVERGYGHQLLAFVEYHDKRFKPYTEKDGLTAEELKEILRARQ